MTPSHAALPALLAAALLAGCATTTADPAATASAPSDCRQLDAEIGRARQARQEAQEQGRSAWKAVVPFAIAARHAKSKAAATEAEQQLDRLQAEFSRQGCAGQAG